jgi:AcrR family transcriptional regulator
MARNRQETEQKLIEAAGRVLAQQGFGQLGVNTIAREAKLDKVLIYRYFDGLAGLMRAYARQGNFWPSTTELMDGVELDNSQQSTSVQFQTVMSNYAKALLARPHTLKILSWEMVERNELTAYLEEVREQQGLEMIGYLTAIQEQHPGVDMAAFSTLISAAINYLAARSQHIQWFNGINLQNDQGWLQLQTSIGQLAAALFSE